MKWIKCCCIGLLIAGVVGFAGCGGSGDSAGVTDDEIVIGSWGPLTGPAALWGNIVRGTDAYFKMINEEGGIHGRKIRFVYKDDGYEPPRTISAVRQMVQNDRVFAIVGGTGTAPGMAVKQYILDHKIPWIAPASGSTHFTIPPTKYIFGVYPYYSHEASIQVNYALDELGVEKIAIIYQNDDYGKGGLIGAEMALEARGMEITEKVSVEIMDSDLSSHAALLQKSEADVVLMWLLPRQATMITSTTAVTGYKPIWIASSPLSDMELMYEITDGRWENVIFTNLAEMPSSNSDEIKNYRTAFKKYYPDLRWGTFAEAGFLFAIPLVEALQAAGRNLTREALIRELESLEDFRALGASITFTPNNRHGNSSVSLVKCLGPTEFEQLTDFTEADIDIEEAIRRLAE